MKKHRILFISFVILVIGVIAYKMQQQTTVELIPVPRVHVSTPSRLPQNAHFSGIGTEPFRAFTLSGDKLSRNSPEWSGTFVGISYVGLSGRQMLYENIRQGISIMTSSGACSDGMSTTNYPASVTIILSGTHYSGCIK